MTKIQKLLQSPKKSQVKRAIEKPKHHSLVGTLPPEILGMIVQHLDHKIRSNVRKTCTVMMKVVDTEQRLEFFKWKRSCNESQKIYWLPFHRFVSAGFAPPVLQKKIEEAKIDTFEPIPGLCVLHTTNRIFSKRFRDLAQLHFTATTLRILFTLTLLDFLKLLSATSFEHREIQINENKLKLKLTIQDSEHFGVLWRSTIDHPLMFEEFDMIVFALMRLKLLQNPLMHQNLPTYGSLYNGQHDFGHTLLGFFPNPLNKKLNIELEIKSDPTVLDALNDFMTTEEFEELDEPTSFQCKVSFTASVASQCE